MEGHEQQTKMDKVMQDLKDGVQAVFDSDRYKEFLVTMGKFHQYSVNNTILIAMQKPDASLVAGYRAWQDKFGRQVIKGSKAINILAPIITKEKSEEGSVGADGLAQPDPGYTLKGFTVKSVFDVSQTFGKEIPNISPEILVGNVAMYRDYIDILDDISPVPIRFDRIEGGANGYYSSVDKEIVIDDRLSEKQTLKTGIHEISHATLHDYDYLKAEDIHKDRTTMEVEAESVAFVVCSYLGLPTEDYSFPYIAGWSSGKELTVLQGSLETIRKTADSMISDIQERLEHLPRYEIYQISERGKMSGHAFEPYEQVKDVDFDSADYDRVYIGPLDGQTLEEIFKRFNIDRPDDFTGHSLSVSDVIVVHEADKTDYAFYVDSFGFQELKDFHEKEVKHEKQKEKTNSR